MFGFGKSKEEKQKEAQNKELDKLWEYGIKSVNVFGGLIQDNRYGTPGVVYDVSVLPVPKDVLLEGVLIFIKLASPEYDQQVEMCAAVLPSLSQYQPGIGSEPLGADMSKLDFTLSGDEAIKQWHTKVSSAKMPSDQLKAQVKNEEFRISQQVESALFFRKKAWKS